MEHRKKFLWTQIVNISAAVVLGMLCLQELRSLLIPLRILTVCAHMFTMEKYKTVRY